MQPRKSKALIITFIVVLGLLIAGYFLVVRGGILKGDSSVGKKFSPLLGTPKQKDVLVGTDPSSTDNGNSTDTTNPNTTTPASNTPTGGNTGTTGGLPNSGAPVAPKYVPPNLSFPQPSTTTKIIPSSTLTTECNDGKDNDKDGSTDSDDNDCHSDSNAKNTASFMPNYSTEAGSKNTPGGTTPQDPTSKKAISCNAEETPLIFTAEEQAQLDELTREFYRLAPQLKTENDIVGEVSSYWGYVDLINNAQSLITQCRDQTRTAAYLRNDIDQDVIPKEQSKEYWLSIGFYKDGAPDGDNISAGYIPTNINCAQYPELCHEEKQMFKISSTNLSIPEKGRTERLRNPYYDSSKEPYPFKETESYSREYYLNPSSLVWQWTWNAQQKKWVNGPTPAGQVIWDWASWEKQKQIW